MYRQDRPGFITIRVSRTYNFSTRMANDFGEDIHLIRRLLMDRTVFNGVQASIQVLFEEGHSR